MFSRSSSMRSRSMLLQVAAAWLWLGASREASAQEPQLLTSSAQADTTQAPAPSPETVMCEAPSAACSNDGLCTDLMRDPNHCGECGHSCGGSACEAGKCSTRWNKSGLMLGMNMGGLWGETHADTAGGGLVRFKPFTPNHWLLSAQIGRRGRWISAGARVGFSYHKESPTSDFSYANSLVRLGPFLGVNVFQRDLGPINLAAYVEGALYLDVLPTAIRNDRPSGTNYTLTWLNLVPSLGAGVDLGVYRGLRVGFYGGFNVNGHLTQFSSLDVIDPVKPHTFVGGEFRGTVAYKFGAGAPALNSIYALLHAGFAQEGAAGREAYAFGTPRYESGFSGYRKVAVAAPSSCENRSTSGLVRDGVSAGEPGTRAATEVLATQCGVEMALLERVLAENGYTVTSWRTLAQSNGVKTPIDLAREYGAEVLFQVNSLERTARVRGDGEVNYEWRLADAFGHSGPMLQSALPLTSNDVGQLNQIALQNQGVLNQGSVAGAMADVNAIDVGSGETIWLYRWERPVPSALQSHGDLLVNAGWARDPNLRRWDVVVPLPTRPRQVAAPQAPTLVTQVNVSAGIAPDPNLAQDALLESIVRDFVHKFQTGTGRQAPAPALLPPPPPAMVPVAPAAPPK